MISISKTNQVLTADNVARVRQALAAFKKRNDVGFKDLPARESLWSESLQRAKIINKISDVVFFVGTGGSSLGGRTLLQALKYCYSVEFIHFIDNVDPMTLNYHLGRIEKPERAHWVFISKSGGTMETLAVANAVDSWLKSRGLALHQFATVVSEAKSSPLMDWARAHSVPQLEIPIDVGGRFSVLSPVGLLPAAVVGASLDEIKAGSIWAAQQDELIVELAAHCLQSFDREEMITQFWVYSDGLQLFGTWLQQLWAESLSKAETRDGGQAPFVSTPMDCLGTCDQHSILQQVIEGQKDKFVWFFRVQAVEESTFSKSSVNLFPRADFLADHSLGNIMFAEERGTFEAMVKNNVSALELTWRDLSPESLGAGFMLFEWMTAVVGEALNINAFDQPGVELGKKLAKEILARSKS